MAMLVYRSVNQNTASILVVPLSFFVVTLFENCATFKTLMTFHYTGWLIGIVIMAYWLIIFPI